MLEFLTTRGVSNWIEKIIIEAEKELVLISPYLKLSKDLKDRLEDASKRDIKITIIYGKDELKSVEKKFIENLMHIELYFLNNLHAKCYYNEKNLVMSSMNMYEYSEINNREMGILIDKESNKELYLNITKEAQSFREHAEIQYNNSKKRFKYDSVKSSSTEYSTKNTYNNQHICDHIKGFCIRCATPIKYNFKKPMCNSCYNQWSFWQNYDYIENVCHCCGENLEASFGRPVCLPCYKS